MATYGTSDFADFPGDWTEQYNTAGTFSVSSGDLTLDAGATNDWRALTWNDLDGDSNRANIEVLALIRFTSLSSTTQYPLIVRGSGGDETATLYAVGVSTTSSYIRYCSGSDTPVLVGNYAVSYTANTDYRIRFRVNGIAVQLKIWADGSGEPGSWDIDVTDSMVSAAGWNGVSKYSTSGACTWKALSYGTNGDTAPDFPAGASATSLALMPRFPRAILNF